MKEFKMSGSFNEKDNYKKRPWEKEESTSLEKEVTDPRPRNGHIKSSNRYIKVHRSHTETDGDCVAIMGHNEPVTVSDEKNDHLYVPRLNGWIRKKYFQEG